MHKTHIAIVQQSPVYLDLDASMQKATSYIQEAAEKGAQLIVFGETWLSGYPAWLDHCPDVAIWDHPPIKKVYTRMALNSVVVPGPQTRQLARLAQEHRVVIGIGVNERVVSGPGQGTLYNSLLIFNEAGELAVHHRKLMPTFTEKMLYGTGDGHGLRTANTKLGRIGGLICWEHWMPLTRQALHDQGERIHLALWPQVHEKLQLASRHYAFEGRCFVVAVGSILRARDLPSELRLPDHLQEQPDALLLNGNSCVIGPDGEYLLSPQEGSAEIFMVDIPDLNMAIGEQMTLDVSGHYQRRDVFRFKVKRRRR